MRHGIKRFEEKGGHFRANYNVKIEEENIPPTKKGFSYRNGSNYFHHCLNFKTYSEPDLFLLAECLYVE